MNDTNQTMVDAHAALDLVEILDAEGNPTGQYKASEGEAASEEATFIAEDAPSHAVVVA